MAPRACSSNLQRGTPRGYRHVPGLRAEVRRAGYDRVQLLLPGDLARAHHAALLQIA